MIDLLLLFLGIFSLLFIHLRLRGRLKMLNHGRFRSRCSFSRYDPGIIGLCKLRFLRLSICILKMHLVTRGCIQKLLRMVYPAYGQSDIQTAELFAL